jgi:hypothetical protein
MGQMRNNALRATALLTGCIGLAAFVLACSKPADNSTAGAEATIQRQKRTGSRPPEQARAMMVRIGTGVAKLTPPMSRT